mgnify:CR=1 FL=1
MAELKTKPTQQSVDAFLQSIPDERKRQDCYTLLEMMQQISGKKPQMWGDSIVGFGDHHYRYATGREGDYFQVGFSPRKQNLTVYITTGFDRYKDILARLGKHSTSISCLYIKKLADVDMTVLRELVARSFSEQAQS